MAQTGSVTPEIRLKVLALTKGLDQQDFTGELIVLNAFVRDNIRYIRDPYGVETVHTPQATLELGQGDCDDKATLLASLLMASGAQCRFVVLERGGQFLHVWTQTTISGIPIDCETTLPLPIGDTAAKQTGDRRHIWPIAAYGTGL